MDDSQLKVRLSGMALRVQMTLMITAVTAFGAGLNYLCQLSNFDQIGPRYLLVFTCSYLFFFPVFRVWLWYAVPEVVDPPSKSDGSWNFWPRLRANRGSKDGPWGGGGGRYAGGGASGSWDSGSATAVALAPVPSHAEAMPFEVGDLVPKGKIDKDEAGLILIVAAVAILSCVVLFIVFAAPQILIDCGLQYAYSHSLIRRIKGRDPGYNWATVLLRETWWVFALILIIAVGAGYYVNAICPMAHHLLDLTRDVCVYAKPAT